MRAVLRFVCWLALMLASAGAGSTESVSVVVVSSESGAAYQEASEALLLELQRTGTAQSEVVQITAAELAIRSDLQPRLFVGLGGEAAVALSRRDTKAAVLLTLLPRASYERVLRDSGRKSTSSLSALYLNQPLARQLNLMQLALPQARRVGVLFGSETQPLTAAMQEAVQSKGWSLVSAQLQTHEPVFTGLKRVLDDADVLFAVADPQIYNSASIQNILLTSYRQRVPMLAFSPAYVRAGALLAVYSTPSQIGRQAGVLARGVLQGRPLGAPQFPSDFSVSVNDHVARSLDLSLDADDLAQRLRRLEKVR